MKHQRKYPGASAYKDRHGTRRWRFRSRGFTKELGTDYGSDEFERRYDEAINGQKSKAGAGVYRTKAGTVDDLIAQFYKLHFPNIEESTRADYRATIEPLREKHGLKRVAHLRVPHVMKIKAEMAATPQQANKALKRLSQLLDLAVLLEWRPDNPVKAVERFKISNAGYHTWDEGEIEQFYGTYPLGSPAHLAMTLMLYTGASKVDAVKLGQANIIGGRLVYRRQKTRKNPSGIEVDIPIHYDLAAALEHCQGKFTFLETGYGKSRSRNGLGTSMRKWCDKANLPLCSSHGLRKAICRRIAEAGGTVHEIMSVSGHVTVSEAQRYCETFGRKSLADSAFAKLSSTKIEQNLTNHPKRFVK